MLVSQLDTDYHIQFSNWCSIKRHTWSLSATSDWIFKSLQMLKVKLSNIVVGGVLRVRLAGYSLSKLVKSKVTSPTVTWQSNGVVSSAFASIEARVRMKKGKALRRVIMGVLRELTWNYLNNRLITWLTSPRSLSLSFPVMESLTSVIYHEKQQQGSMLCAQHALNSLLRLFSVFFSSFLSLTFQQREIMCDCLSFAPSPHRAALSLVHRARSFFHRTSS
jgi:hypothetical protein